MKRCGGDMRDRSLKAPGYLASVTASEEEAMDTNACPWRITVLPGQRINITLFDFNLVSRPTDRSDSGTVCQVYAMITEVAASTDITVCGGEQRQRMVYLSETNSIDIQVVTITDEDHHGHFLLKYEGKQSLSDTKKISLSPLRLSLLSSMLKPFPFFNLPKTLRFNRVWSLIVKLKLSWEIPFTQFLLSELLKEFLNASETRFKLSLGKYRRAIACGGPTM